MSDAVETVETEQKSTLEGKSADELIEIIRETRKEAKERRLKEKEVSEKLSQLEAKIGEEEQNKKIAEGKKDEVILELQQKLKLKDDEYKPVIEKATKYDEYDSAKRDELKESLQDSWMTSFDTMPLIELEKLASKLTNVKLPDSDNGSNKKPSPKEYFTLEELKTLTAQELANKDTLAKANKSLEYHSKK